jgi:hypothetical protein
VLSAIAKGSFAHDQRTVVILQRTGDDLGSGSGIAIHDDDDGISRGAFFAVRGAVDLVRKRPATLRDHDLALLQQFVRDIHRLVQQAAWVAAEVDHETVQIAVRGAELVERIAEFPASRLRAEVDNVDVADARLEHEGEVDGRVRNGIANQIKGERSVLALASHHHADVGPFGSFEQACDRSRVHSVGRLAVNRHDHVAGTDACLERRRSFKRGQDNDVQHSVLVRLRLDRHADAVVVAVLIFAHLGEGFGIVEVRMGVEDVKHAGNRTVIDGFVDLVAVERLGVVLLDDGIHVRELV